MKTKKTELPLEEQLRIMTARYTFTKTMLRILTLQNMKPAHHDKFWKAFEHLIDREVSRVTVPDEV